ncbi:MAG: hypothetical protein GY796_19350 [Chloroflexi bacterium]|nr:hypothetical protein [Chloroflexota bacterium]
MTPEQKARQQIDKLLHYAGWGVQDREQMNLFDQALCNLRHPTTAVNFPNCTTSTT